MERDRERECVRLGRFELGSFLGGLREIIGALNAYGRPDDGPGSGPGSGPDGGPDGGPDSRPGGGSGGGIYGEGLYGLGRGGPMG